MTKDLDQRVTRLSDDELDATLKILIDEAPTGMVDDLFMYFLREKHKRFMNTINEES